MNSGDNRTDRGQESPSALLSVSLTVPVSWQSGLELAVSEAGPAVVRALATAVTLAERPPLVNEDAMGLELEVARLHQKTQLLIELLALSLSRMGNRPSAVDACLSGSRCRWQSASMPVSGSIGALAVWLHPAAPEPMSWPAQIVEVSSQSDGSHRIEAELLPLGEAAQAALDRYIFQLHRRAIAEARSQRC